MAVHIQFHILQQRHSPRAGAHSFALRGDVHLWLSFFKWKNPLDKSIKKASLSVLLSNSYKRTSRSIVIGRIDSITRCSFNWQPGGLEVSYGLRVRDVSLTCLLANKSAPFHSIRVDMSQQREPNGDNWILFRRYCAVLCDVAHLRPAEKLVHLVRSRCFYSDSLNIASTFTCKIRAFPSLHVSVLSLELIS